MHRGLTLGLLLLVGCAQTTRTPAETEQATQGSDVNVYVWGTGQVPEEGGLAWAEIVNTSGVSSWQGGDAYAKDAHAGYVVIAHVTVTTGGTTPTAETASTSTTRQDVAPEISGSIPVSVAPGGLADATGTSGSGGSTVSTEQEKQLDARIANLEAQQESMLDLLRNILDATPEDPGQ